MQATIQYLSQHPDLMDKVKEGKASLLGVSKQESEAIVEVLKSYTLSVNDYWHPK